MLSRLAQSPRVSRRLLVGSGLAGAAVLPLASLRRASAVPARSSVSPSIKFQGAVSSPDGWPTWYLSAPDEFRPAAPGAASQAEIDEVIAIQAAATEATAAAVARWGQRAAVLAWTDVARAAFIESKISPIMASRASALLYTAMHDAVLVAWDAQVAHQRPSPAATSDAITPAGAVDPARPSFPSEHAAVAGAAATVLAYVLPDAAHGRFDALAAEAAESRLAAGAAFRSDVDAGLALGVAIGARAVVRGKSDGSDAKWDGSSGRLTGDGYWVPTPPAFVETPAVPLAGTWQTWVLPGGDAVRPGPPPDYGSPAWAAQLAAVRQACAGRTLEQEQAAYYWEGTHTGEVAPVTWSGLAAHLIVRHGFDLPHAARALALANVAMFDASVAAWDAKYTYWMARPVTADPDLALLFPTPPHPSYPSGHATVSGAASVTLAALFPQEEADLLGLAAEAAASRCWAGIHFPYDDDVGLAIGHAVGYLVAEFARTDGVD
jgi:membrane-associated phospholipid phosphatase